MNRSKKKCLVCKENMLVAPGQEAKYHGACRSQRPKGRKAK